MIDIVELEIYDSYSLNRLMRMKMNQLEHFHGQLGPLILLAGPLSASRWCPTVLANVVKSEIDHGYDVITMFQIMLDH